MKIPKIISETTFHKPSIRLYFTFEGMGKSANQVTKDQNPVAAQPFGGRVGSHQETVTAEC